MSGPDANAPPPADHGRARGWRRVAGSGAIGVGVGLAVGGVCLAVDGLRISGVAAGLSAGLAAGLGYTLMRARREQTATLDEARARLSRGAASCLFTWSPGESAWLSPRWSEAFGITALEEGEDLSFWLDRVHPKDHARLQRGLDELAEGLRDELRVVHRIRRGDAWRWAEVHAVRAIEGGKPVVVGSVLDVTAQRDTEAKLAYNAFHDALTGLPNRALFTDRLAHCTARARRNPRYRFAVLFLDIDDFKVINDSLGHLSGDALLCVIAERLRRCVRPGDTVARLGGDEFTVLLDPIEGPAQAEEVARRINAAIQEPCEVHGHSIQTSASIGIALSAPTYHSPQELLRDADLAMYRAKRDGKGIHRLFDPAMHDSAMRRLQIETELVGAIEGGRLTVHYQPIIALSDGHVEGFEALARLQSASGEGMISPAEFIPVAEESGMIDAVLDHVLALATADAARWRQRFPDLYVSVNVAARSLRPALLDRVRRALEAQELAPQGLKLELTESALVEGTDAAKTVLEALRDLGVGLYIDDFGTGYSSLSYMHRFPVERLKIDRSFVSDLREGHPPAVIETIIALSRRIGAGAIAEGLETIEQVRALRRLGCPSGQGYYFAPALPPEDADHLLASGRRWALEDGDGGAGGAQEGPTDGEPSGLR